MQDLYVVASVQHALHLLPVVAWNVAVHHYQVEGDFRMRENPLKRFGRQGKPFPGNKSYSYARHTLPPALSLFTIRRSVKPCNHPPLCREHSLHKPREHDLVAEGLIRNFSCSS